MSPCDVSVTSSGGPSEGFSGGEKKRNEILQLAVLESEMSILDEIDSGLDVDALRDVAAAVNILKVGRCRSTLSNLC
jgi:Fe-S cluster assembly ATPase SufC